MNEYNISGYAWIAVGVFCLIFFANQLLVQMLGIIIGWYCIAKGLQILSIDSGVHSYSVNFFQNKYRK